MWLRLRQIALVSADLPAVERDICEVLGVAVCYRDPGVATFGLHNALFPIGNQILEVVAPTREGTTAGRYLERRGGDGGYMVITQCDDHSPRKARVAALGLRVVHAFETPHFRNMQLHPKDTGGSFFEIDEVLGECAHDEDGPWEPAGRDWQTYKRTERVAAIVGAVIQAGDPERVARRWSEIAEVPLSDGLTLPLANADVRFTTCDDGRPEGLGGIVVRCNDGDAILRAADARGLPCEGTTITLAGIRMELTH